MLASIVIPVYQAAGFLPRTAPTWLEQDLDEPFEVLLVDNGSTDGGVAELDQHPRLRRLHEPVKGAYAARNTGAAASTGEYLVFTDPDCAAPPGWLGRLVEPLRRDPGIAAVQGPAWPCRDNRRLRALAAYETQREAAVYTSEDPLVYYAHTNNFAVRRDVFERIGPFVLRARGSDTLLARRLVDALGCGAMAHAPDAPVDHLEIDSCRVWFKKMFLYGRSRYADGNASKLRALNHAERIRLLLDLVRTSRITPFASLELFGLLLLGQASWVAGRTAGHVMAARMEPP